MDLKKIGLFAGGVLFGTAGIKALSSKDAKKAYTQTTAAALRVKDRMQMTSMPALRRLMNSVPEKNAALSLKMLQRKQRKMQRKPAIPQRSLAKKRRKNAPKKRREARRSNV